MEYIDDKGNIPKIERWSAGHFFNKMYPIPVERWISGNLGGGHYSVGSHCGLGHCNPMPEVKFDKKQLKPYRFTCYSEREYFQEYFTHVNQKSVNLINDYNTTNGKCVPNSPKEAKEAVLCGIIKMLAFEKGIEL